MPEELLGSGSEFDSAKRVLGRWLRENLGEVRVLSLDELKRYEPKRFVAGWHLSVTNPAGVLLFDVVVDARFPYSPIRIAYRSEDAFLRWPHVEEAGVLCLPRRPPPSASVKTAIAASLDDACSLVAQCREPGFVEAEFEREFVSYWHHSLATGAKPIRSLLNLANHQSRLIAVWFGAKYALVGETAQDVEGWLANMGRTERSEIIKGVFGYLDRPPTPPFPKTPREVLALIDSHANSVAPLLARLSILDKTTIVLAAASPSGIGLMGMTVSRPSNFNGFRKSEVATLSTMRTLWSTRSSSQRTEVQRVDASWVHGRDMNTHQPALAAAKVLILGCGSLGSQVGMRLAQSGVGGIVAIDPDELSAANVERHALGIDNVGTNKAAALAKVLRSRFPHMRHIEHFPLSWQQQYANDPSVFQQANIIVACMGEWEADGQLGEWQRRPGTPPIIFGWLDEHGTAAHAVALTNTGPALSCILNSGGSLRVPETLWHGEGLLRTEPACGTLYQPYGAIDVASGEVLVSRLCIELLTGQVKPPCHRVYSRSTRELEGAGGQWSEEHLRHRPANFSGAFEYERTVTKCGECPSCRQVQ